MFGGLRAKLEASIREIVFGLEDALVSTLGAVTGVAAGTGNVRIVLLTGIVLIFVEALSMSAGSYLSSKSAKQTAQLRRKQDRARLLQRRLPNGQTLKEYLSRETSTVSVKDVMNLLTVEQNQWVEELHKGERRHLPSVQYSPRAAAMVMGVFYLAGGIFPLLPYLFFNVYAAILPSILLSGFVLFVLGAAKAKLVQVDWVKSGLEMTIISLAAALLGFGIGRIASILLDINVI